MRFFDSKTLLTGAVAAAAMAGSANADYVLQTFSGSASASVSNSRANQQALAGGFSLGYNAIAGGAASMDVFVGTEIVGSEPPTGKTNAANHGTYSAGFTEGSGVNTKYYKWYYGGNSGTGSSFTANDNFRAWSASSTSAANLSGSVLNVSSSAASDTGIADYTKVRYTSNTYATLYSGAGAAAATLLGDADSIVNSTVSSLLYASATGQAMDMSASTGLTDIRLEGSGTGWATSGIVEFSMTDALGVSSSVLQTISASAAMGNLSASIVDLLANASSGGSPATLDLTQITSFGIAFYAQEATSARNAVWNNGGFSYDASQVTLVGYSVPAPGVVALLGAAGLVGSRRRR